MKIIQHIGFKVIGDDGLVECSEPPIDTEFTVTKHGQLTLPVIKNTVDTEFIFPITGTKLVYLDTTIPIKIRVDSITGEQREVNTTFLINATAALTKLYLSNASLTTDAVVKMIFSDITAVV